ncbi:MAG: AMP-dependent synthetase and ligase [Caulobacteraceae bacterium]|nr:AMP-dependent synthetase and ligase [Caulobacteraceae bacterium]
MSPTDAGQDAPVFVTELLVNALNQDAGRPFLQMLDGETFTVGHFRDEISRYAQALAAAGVRRGVRVALLSANRVEVFYAINAAQVLEGIYVPLHPMAALDDHHFIIADGEVDVLIYDANRYGHRAADLAARAPGLTVLSFGPGSIGQDLCALAAGMAAAPLVAPRVAPEDVMRISYSGGTTGRPKSIGAVQRSALASMTITLSEWEWPARPRTLACAPLSHAGGSLFLPTLLKNGAMLVLPSFEPVAVMQAIQDHQINCTLMVPTMIYALLDHPRFDEFDLSSLETVFYGGSSISPVRLKEAIERIGPVFCQFYGQAEAPMAVAMLRKADHDVGDLRRLASCGRPSPWVRVELLDSENRPVSDGEPGEICVRGPLVMTGYRNNPALNVEVFPGGSLHTRHVALRDPGGFLRIVDRKKDMIVTGGFNVYPREVEDVLSGHPAVAQAAVIGVPHEKWGEAVKAVIVLRDNAQVSAEQLTALVAERKGSFQAPKTIDFVTEIPLTAVGKPDKKALRARYRDATSASR